MKDLKRVRIPPSTMRKGRPYGKLFLHALQFTVLLLLVQAVNNQIWYTAVADIEYTEGLPERAGMEIELEVDQDSADAKIEFTGFFSWVQWQSESNDTTIPSDNEDKEERPQDMDFKPLSEVQDDVPLLVKIASLLSLMMLGLAFFDTKFRGILGIILNLVVLWIIISLVILAPLGYVGELDFTGGPDSTGKDEGESTVHGTFKGSPSIDLFDGELDYDFATTGYDLGLVNQSELDDVIASPPGEEHRSYYEMEGMAGIHYSQFVVELIWAWLVLFLIAPITIGFFNQVRIEKPQLL